MVDGPTIPGIRTPLHREEQTNAVSRLLQWQLIASGRLNRILLSSSHNTRAAGDLARGSVSVLDRAITRSGSLDCKNLVRFSRESVVVDKELFQFLFELL